VQALQRVERTKSSNEPVSKMPLMSYNESQRLARNARTEVVLAADLEVAIILHVLEVVQGLLEDIASFFMGDRERQLARELQGSAHRKQRARREEPHW